MQCKPTNPAQRRFYARVVVVMLLYGLLLAITAIGFIHFHPNGTTAYILAALPAIPVLSIMVVVGLYLAEEKDEFVRNFQLESMLYGIGPTLAVTTIWGGLENFAHVRRLDLALVYPIDWAFVALATVVVKRRYR